MPLLKWMHYSNPELFQNPILNPFLYMTHPEFFLSSWQQNGLVFIRILTGLLMAYHGWEIFDAAKMAEYAKWDVIQSLPLPNASAYVGKGLELVSGLLLALGLFTRIVAVLMAVNMLFICFKIGNGRFYYEDQHPFLFAVLALVFFFTGPIKWSLDQRWFKR
jgi:putative oxidoreductase